MNYLKEKLKFLISSVKKFVGVLTAVSGSSPLDLLSSSGEELNDYTIYGKTAQDGTPTTTTPIEVQSVGTKTDNILVNNLVAGTSGTIAGIDYVVNDDLSISLKGTTTGTFSLRLAGKWANTESVVTLEPNNYTLSGQLSNFYVSTYLKTTAGVTPAAYANTRTKAIYNFNATETKEIGDIFLYCNVSGTTVDGTIYPSLVAGTYDSVDYEPYGKYKIPIAVTRKNLCDNVFYNTTINYSTGVESPNNNYRSIDYIEIDANSRYTLYREQIPTALGLRLYDANKGYLGSIGVQSQTYSFTPAIYSSNKFATAKYIRWTIASTIYIRYIFIQADSIIGEYEDYWTGKISKVFLNEPLNGFGDITDYINFKNKKVIRNCSQYESIGNETFTLSPTSTTSNRCYCSLFLPTGRRAQSTTNQLSNYLAVYPWASSRDYCFYLSNKGLYITIAGITTAEDMTTFIKGLCDAGNPFKVVYQLYTSDLYEENIIMPQISTYDGDCAFKIDTDLSLNVEVKYYKN